ncbi:MAG: GntR family transcriptional regulator [Kiritimatiellia bacterium]|jgi:DNA-binding GntR family transcriptional regulator|nr:GntR family transcriptional regulator [Kiritimatiellia bacterium]MDP6629509.1 GntR family transcriptional regulator [Kiritimatiellia bacterium]MDP6809216.1 GntR family transcriptional regulator [Kiritimatiellia bacterium]MDP7022955.1 GntR family transcriptional regulator [Kiritimatiellia bacterium]
MGRDSLSLADQAYELLEARIVSLELVPGEIYSEAELSALIGVGRTPMREGLLRLAKEKLVEMIPRRGVGVTRIDLTRHVPLLETRKALDVLIATRAARRVTAAQKEWLSTSADAILEAAQRGDTDAFHAIDEALDALLGEACNNPFAVEAVAHLYAHCRRFWVHYGEHVDVLLLARQHAALMQAVAGGDESEAREAVEAIIDYQIEFTRLALDL